LLFLIALYVHDRGIIAYYIPYLITRFSSERKWKIVLQFCFIQRFSL